MAIVLPTSKIQPTETEPRVLVIFSKPKSGKSTALSLLDNNLILDTEGGTAYIEALKVDVSSVKDILEICRQVKAAGYPYKYITLDTLTSLEEILQPYALSLWKKSNAYNPEKNPEQLKVTDIYSLPFGLGQKYMRDSYLIIIGLLQQVCKRIILVCHSKDAKINENELTIKDIDLAGKLSDIIASRYDGAGYLYRDKDDNTIITFDIKQLTAECKCRVPRLDGKKFVLIENRDGKLIPHWDRIYLSEPYSGEDVVTTPQINVTDILGEEESEEENKSKDSNVSKEEPKLDEFSNIEL